MLEYHTSVQQRMLVIIVRPVLGHVAFPDGGDGSHWILTVVQLFGCALLAVGLWMDVRFVAMGNPQAWRIANNMVAVRP
nr:hypothetical protein [Candidatus Kapabacteria bacterium]